MIAVKTKKVHNIQHTIMMNTLRKQEHDKEDLKKPMPNILKN